MTSACHQGGRHPKATIAGGVSVGLRASWDPLRCAWMSFWGGRQGHTHGNKQALRKGPPTTELYKSPSGGVHMSSPRTSSKLLCCVSLAATLPQHICLATTAPRHTPQAANLLPPSSMRVRLGRVVHLRMLNVGRMNPGTLTSSVSLLLPSSRRESSKLSSCVVVQEPQEVDLRRSTCERIH